MHRSDGQISIYQDAIRVEGCTYHLSATYGCGVGSMCKLCSSVHRRYLREAGLKAKPTKCAIAMDHCSYLGHIVGGGQIQMEEVKIAALKDYKRPVTKRDVRAFLGLAGYYRRFVPGFAQLTARISDLTRKEGQLSTGILWFPTSKLLLLTFLSFPPPWRHCLSLQLTSMHPSISFSVHLCSR